MIDRSLKAVCSANPLGYFLAYFVAIIYPLIVLIFDGISSIPRSIIIRSILRRVSSHIRRSRRVYTTLTIPGAELHVHCVDCRLEIATLLWVIVMLICTLNCFILEFIKLMILRLTHSPRLHRIQIRRKWLHRVRLHLPNRCY